VRNTQSNIEPDLFTPPASPIVRNDTQLDQFIPPPSPSNENHISSPVTSRSFTLSAPSTESSGGEGSSQTIPTMRSVTSHARSNKKRKSESESVQSVLENAILADVARAKGEEKEQNDPDELFCKSLVSSFKTLSKKKNKRAKIKVMQILLEMESDDSD